jgi:hypothetical protein
MSAVPLRSLPVEGLHLLRGDVMRIRTVDSLLAEIFHQHQITSRRVCLHVNNPLSILRRRESGYNWDITKDCILCQTTRSKAEKLDSGARLLGRIEQENAPEEVCLMEQTSTSGPSNR